VPVNFRGISATALAASLRILHVDSGNARALIKNGQSSLTALETWIVGRYRGAATIRDPNSYMT